MLLFHGKENLGRHEKYLRLMNLSVDSKTENLLFVVSHENGVPVCYRHEELLTISLNRGLSVFWRNASTSMDKSCSDILHDRPSS
jgi:hypothetical protein